MNTQYTVEVYLDHCTGLYSVTDVVLNESEDYVYKSTATMAANKLQAELGGDILWTID